MASDHDLHDANDDARDAAQAALFRRHVADDADDVTIDLAINADFAQLLAWRESLDARLMEPLPFDAIADVDKLP